MIHVICNDLKVHYVTFIMKGYVVMLDTVRVFRTVRVWYIPYAYTRTVQPYAYGMAICTIWVSTIFSLFSYILTQYCLIFVLDLYFHRSTPYAVFCRVMFLHSPL